VLEVAGGVEGGADDALGELVEDEQVGLELADFGGDFFSVEFPLSALTFAEGAVGPVGSDGLVALVAGSDVFADDPAVDPPGAGVIALSIGAGFPGHEVTGELEVEQARGALHNDVRRGRDAWGSIGYRCSLVK
jgi:hypothetical protein